MQTKAQAKEASSPEGQTHPSHQGPQIPVDADDRVCAPSHQAGASAHTDTVRESQGTDPSDHHTDTTIAALQSCSMHRQMVGMDAIKAHLQDILDNLGQHQQDHQEEHSDDLDELLLQWTDIWQNDRTKALLVYVLDDWHGLHNGQQLCVDSLHDNDKRRIYTLVLQQSIKLRTRLHLAKMTSVMSTNSNNLFDVRTAIELVEVHDLLGGKLSDNDKSIPITTQSIIQTSLLQDRYAQVVAAHKGHKTSSQGSSISKGETWQTFQDCVSPSEVYCSSALDACISHHMQVLVMMPGAQDFDFMVEIANPEGLHNWIMSESALLSASGVDATEVEADRRRGLRTACKIQFHNIRRWVETKGKLVNTKGWYQQAKFLELVLVVSLKVRDSELFGDAILSGPEMLSLASWKMIGVAMNGADFSPSYRKW